jgi:hypothetical protein
VRRDDWRLRSSGAGAPTTCLPMVLDRRGTGSTETKYLSTEVPRYLHTRLTFLHKCLACCGPLFPSRASQPTPWQAERFPAIYYRFAFPSPGLGVMPSSQPIPRVAHSPTRAWMQLPADLRRTGRRLGVFDFWDLPETCHRFTPRRIRLAMAGPCASSPQLAHSNLPQPAHPLWLLCRRLWRPPGSGGGPLGSAMMPCVIAAPVRVGHRASSSPFLRGP